MTAAFQPDPCQPAPRSGGASPPLVSILIVNYNGERLLRACLDSLRCVVDPPHEVVVVENGSSDHSLKLLREYDWVKVVVSEVNLGFAGGNNFGLPHCAGNRVLLLNSDTIVRPAFLRRLCDYLEGHPKVGIVQSKMFLPNREGKLDSCGSFMTRFGFMYHYGLLKSDGPNYQRNYAAFSGKGACMMLRREAIAAAGGYLFNEDFFCYYEETDFCHRAWLAGYETHFVGDSVIDHLMGATSVTAHGPDFVMSHFLSNQIFSLLANLEFKSLVLIMPFYFLFFFASLAGTALWGKWPLLQAHLKALASTVKNVDKIRRQRSIIRRIRKLSDSDIFQRTMRTPRLDYFLKTFRGRIGEFEDDPPPTSAANR